MYELLVSVIQGRGNKSSGDNFHAAPNIDHSQEFVRKDLKEWLYWLRLKLEFHFLPPSNMHERITKACIFLVCDHAFAFFSLPDNFFDRHGWIHTH